MTICIGKTCRPDTTSKKSKKNQRKWDDSGVSEADIAAFDFSSKDPRHSGSSTGLSLLVDSHSLGKTRRDGVYEVAEVIESSKHPSEGTSHLAEIFSRFSFSSKVLNRQDLEPTLDAMRTMLMDKNVARDVSIKIIDGIKQQLEGKKVSGWQAVDGIVRESLNSTLTSILTPKNSTDLLLEISRKHLGANTAPYSIVFCGVNGVGKSTNLSKVAFWLIQNKLRVLIAACDTFRSGAVEQLRVHVNNLSKLEDKSGTGKGETKIIELFEKGYGKDAAGIAKEAISYGTENKFDVVLIDTAGRMQDNEPLMRALAKLVAVNNPDRIVFVGEALVGNEAVDQLLKFDKTLRDFSQSGTVRGIDGIILTKFDTVSDQVGAAVSMTYVIGQPILFVGTGQTYSDLRRLTVPRVVSALLS